MASGRTHNTVSVTAAAIVLTVGLTTSSSFGTAVAVAAGCLLGILIPPDLDIPTYTRTENSLRKSKNPYIAIFGNLYIIFWYPYATLIPHRSWVSHAPIIGTVLRLLYIFVVSAIILGMLGFIAPASWSLAQWLGEEFEYFFPHLLPVFAGIGISDFLHWVFDLGWWKYLTRILGIKI